MPDNAKGKQDSSTNGRFHGLLEKYDEYGSFGAYGRSPRLLRIDEFLDMGHISENDLWALIENHKIWPQVKLPEAIWLRRIPCNLTILLYKEAKYPCDKFYSVNIPNEFDDNTYREIINSRWNNIPHRSKQWEAIDSENLWVSDFHFAITSLTGFFIGKEQINNIMTYGDSIINNLTIPTLARVNDIRYKELFDKTFSYFAHSNWYYPHINLLKTPYEKSTQPRMPIYDDWETTIITADRLSRTNSIAMSKMEDFIDKCDSLQEYEGTSTWAAANKGVWDIIDIFRSKEARRPNNNYELFMKLLDLSCYMDKWIPALRQQANVRISRENIFFSEDQLEVVHDHNNPAEKKANKRPINVRSIVAQKYEANANKILVAAAKEIFVKLRKKGKENNDNYEGEWIVKAAEAFENDVFQMDARRALDNQKNTDDLHSSIIRYLTDLVYKNRKEKFE